LEVKDTDKRLAIIMEYKLDKIDVEGGIVLITKNDEPMKDGGKDSPEDDCVVPGVSTFAPRGGLWFAGLATALAVMLGGTWLVGRTRRKV
jgi:hypothetical protein